MALRQFQTNFTGGEQSPQLRARLDFKGYQNGAELLKNLTVRVQGGAARRAGTLFIHAAMNTDQRSWLFPFIFSNEQAYVLEFAPLTIRIFRDRALLTGEGDGTELLTNGTFAADLASWSEVNTGTGGTAWNAASGGVARMNAGAAGTTRMGQGITTIVGTEYVLSWTSTWTLTVQIGITDGGITLLNESFTAGARKVKFTATATTTWVHFASSENRDIDLDTVSVQVAEAIVIGSPYTADAIPELRMAQSADVLYLFHPDFQPYKLLRITTIEWELREVNFVPPPTRELPQVGEATLTPAATTGVNIQFDASGNVFLAGDKAKMLRGGAGRATIVTVNSASQVHADIIDDFSSTDVIAAGQWSLVGSPNQTLTPSVKSPVGEIVTLTAGGDAFRVTDLGKYVRVHSGFVQITGFTSATVVTGEILAVLTAIVAAEAGNWTIEDPIWSDDRGWPGAAVFHEQRLVAGGSALEPLTFVGSQTADFENFLLGSEDNAAYDYVIPGPFDRIRALVSLRRLLIGTVGGWLRAQGGSTDAAITPGNPPLVVPENDKGVDPTVAPVIVNNAVLALQRGAQRIREVSYGFTDDAYNAVDLTILADHLTAVGLEQIARITSPDSYVLAIRSDGALLCCAYERPEQVVAWSRWITGRAQDLSDGAFESVCVIPNACGTGDEIWVAVRRQVDGATVRFIEVFDGGLQVDAAVRVSGDAVDTVTATHLANETAMVVADGVDFEAPVDELGLVQVGEAATVQAGLGFFSRLRTMPPEANTQGGLTVARLRRVVDAFVRMACVGDGWTVNGQPFVAVAGDEDETIKDGLVANLGWGRKGRITVEQRRPFGGTILGIGGRMEVEDDG